VPWGRSKDGEPWGGDNGGRACNGRSLNGRDLRYRVFSTYSLSKIDCQMILIVDHYSFGQAVFNNFSHCNPLQGTRDLPSIDIITRKAQNVPALTCCGRRLPPPPPPPWALQEGASQRQVHCLVMRPLPQQTLRQLSASFLPLFFLIPLYVIFTRWQPLLFFA